MLDLNSNAGKLLEWTGTRIAALLGDTEHTLIISTERDQKMKADCLQRVQCFKSVVGRTRRLEVVKS